MNDREFYNILKIYIEQTEVIFDEKYGKSRTIEELKKVEVMPSIYHEVLRRIKA